MAKFYQQPKTKEQHSETIRHISIKQQEEMNSSRWMINFRRGQQKVLRILLINFKFKMENHQPKTQKIPMLAEQLSESWDQDSLCKSFESQSTSPKLHIIIQDQVPPFVVTKDYKIRREQSCFQPESDGSEVNIQDKILSYNRKDKSLMELTRKFIQKFEGACTNTLILDQVTSELHVERRRIYDIINIMESLAVVSKIRKNVYEWKGLQKAIETIEQLNNGDFYEENDRLKRQKSLESLATQFLKLFSRSKQYLTLEQAAQIILSEANENVKKTKIRRLYDIINVFKCLGLVEKVKCQKQAGSKPMYRWLGYQQLIKIIEGKKISQKQESRKKESSIKIYKDENKSSNLNNKNSDLSLDKPEINKKFTFYPSPLNQGLRDISNQDLSLKLNRRNSQSAAKDRRIKPKLEVSFITTKSVNYESRQAGDLSTVCSEEHEGLDPVNGSLGQGPSFFFNLAKILNWGQTSTVSEIQEKLRQSIWPR